MGGSEERWRRIDTTLPWNFPATFPSYLTTSCQSWSQYRSHDPFGNQSLPVRWPRLYQSLASYGSRDISRSNQGQSTTKKKASLSRAGMQLTASRFLRLGSVAGVWSRWGLAQGSQGLGIHYSRSLAHLLHNSAQSCLQTDAFRYRTALPGTDAFRYRTALPFTWTLPTTDQPRITWHFSSNRKQT